MKYQVPQAESEILPNIKGLISAEEIALAEFEGFLESEIRLTEKLNKHRRFTVKYILGIHKLALSGVYQFAGKYREVNLSKGGFPFASARFLPETMLAFEKEILAKLPRKYSNKEDLIKDIAIVHAELLVIHPFREGNGRTARILANLMARKEGYSSLSFDKIDDEKQFEKYVFAIQNATLKNYDPMIKLIALIFPD